MSDRRLLLAIAVVLDAGIAGIVIGLASCRGDEKTALPTGSTVGTPEGRAPFVAVLLPGGDGTRWVEDANAIDQALSDAEVEHSVDTAGDPEVAGVPFWADSAVFAAAGIPTVVYGPGGEGAHAQVEWVDLADLERCKDVYVAVAKELCA